MSATKQFNVILINKAGKVGKSTLAKHLIAPTLDADWIQVETFNDTGQGAAAKVAGRKFGYVAEAVAVSTRSKCIDIGNSNYEAAKKEIQEIDGFVDEIDFWVVPCKESAGVMNDSLSTAAELMNEVGVDPSRIVVIPNEIERPEQGLERFASVARAAQQLKFHFCEVPVAQNPSFDVFNRDGRSILEIADEYVDYRALIVAETDLERKARLAEAKVLYGRARFLARNLRAAWNASPLSSMTEAAAIGAC